MAGGRTTLGFSEEFLISTPVASFSPIPKHPQPTKNLCNIPCFFPKVSTTLGLTVSSDNCACLTLGAALCPPPEHGKSAPTEHPDIKRQDLTFGNNTNQANSSTTIGLITISRTRNKDWELSLVLQQIRFAHRHCIIGVTYITVSSGYIYLMLLSFVQRDIELV
ncbi:hypothetical protein Fcan01_13518 [Folsomia candida]|uniref:Uncharacterized protein n=1 Tax=Folsomia candida TaxID=158441 RepID=A0A226E375_FOLCA|nr:hypothetical protein Fcan01_13518 [Folsomia candida]